MKVECIYQDNKNNLMVFLNNNGRVILQKHKLDSIECIPELNQEFKDLKQYRDFIGGKQNGKREA